MANELWHNYQSGFTLYALIRRKSDDFVYINSGSNAFEAFNVSNIGTYDIPMADDGGDYYSVDFPSDIIGDTFRITVVLQVGGSPAAADIEIAQGELYWDEDAGEEIDLGVIFTNTRVQTNTFAPEDLGNAEAQQVNTIL